MNRDVKPESMEDGTCLENRNVVKSKFIDAYINEYGFLIFQKVGSSGANKFGTTITISSVDYHLKVIGNVICDDDKFVIFSSGFVDNLSISTTKSFDEIGIINKEGYYQTVIRDFDNSIYTTINKLGFNSKYPISGEFEYNKSNELICAFVSKAFTPKIINIDYYLNNPPTIGVPFQINDIKMFPDLQQSNTTVVINETGTLPAGTYYLCYKYRNYDGTETDYSLINDPQFIFADSLGSIVAAEGSKQGASTNKAILVTITTPDLNYDYIVLGCITHVNGAVTSYEVKQVSIANTTINFSNLLNATPISVNEILVRKDKYSKFTKITQVSKRLYAFGVEKNDVDDYQPFANNITVRWKSKIKSPLNVAATDSAKLIKNNYTEKSFCHREVYALYIHLILKDGTISKGFHIPGRAAVGTEATDLCDIPDVYGVIDTGGAKVFQYEDSVPAGFTNNAGTGGESNGLMSYWENATEKYPDNSNFDIHGVDGYGNPTYIGTLKNTPVRHHKMPSITWMAANIYNVSNLPSEHYGATVLDALGLYITNVKFPNSIKDKISGWFISYGERNFSNNLILGQSHSLCASYSYSIGQTSNGINAQTDYNGNINILQKDVFRLYDFNLIKKQPVIPASYIRNELFFESAGRYLGQIVDRTTFECSMINNLGGRPSDPSNPSGSGNDSRYRKINSLYYIPARVIIGGYDNRWHEECVLVNLSRTVAMNTYGVSVHTISDAGSNIAIETALRSQSYLTNIISSNKDCYYNFSAQKLIHSTDISFGVANSGNYLDTYKGDCFLSVNSVNTYGNVSPVATDVTEWNGVRNSMSWLCESVVNSEMRNSTSGDVATYYTPRASLPYGSTNYLNALSNYTARLPYDFNNDYFNDRDFYLLEPFNFRLVDILKYYYRVPRSSPFAVESTKNFWKTWLVNDYHELNKNKGIIQDIVGVGRNLFIITRQSTFLTTGNEQLNLSTSNAYIGAGNIFEREPIEIIPSKEGSIGTQNSYCNIVTKYGLVIIDREYGSIWIVDKQGKSTCISDKGFRQWGLDNLDYIIEDSSFEEDNPYNLFGYTSVYDLYNDRLIIAKKYYQLTDAAKTLLTNSISDSHAYMRYVDGRFIYHAISTGNPTLIELTNTTYFINKSFTMSYSFIDNDWSSFHDYYPDFLITTRNILTSFKSIVVNGIQQSRIFKHNNLLNRGIYYNTTKLDIDDATPEAATPFSSYWIPVFNKASRASKLFFSISWIARVFKLPNNTFIQNETFDSIHAWNNFQSTNETPLIVYSYNDDTSNTRQSKGTWFFNKLRDLLRLDIFTNPNPPLPFIKDYKLNSSNTPIDTTKEFQTKRALIDKYLAIKLLYNNKISSNLQNEIQVIDIDTNVQPVER